MITSKYENNVMARASSEVHPVNPGLMHGAMGLNEEAGEVLAIVRKAVFYGKPLDTDKIKLELGDTLWFLTLAAKSVGSSLDELMVLNDAKLAARYGGTKFDADKAINKDEVKEAAQLSLIA
jgi:NTP pyrophosphatase (non-canonical NTP hydrolase)